MHKIFKLISLMAAAALLFTVSAFADTYSEAPTLVTDYSYDAALTPSEGLCAVAQNGKWGFVTGFGEQACEMIYEACLPFSEGAAAVKLDGKWGFVTVSMAEGSGWKTTPAGDFIWEETSTFSEGLCAVGVSGKWGYIDENFTLKVACEYDEVTDFSGGYAAVRVGDKWGVLSAAGDITVEPKYDDLSAFSDGIAAFGCSTGRGVIFGSGYVLIQPVWSSAVVSDSGITLHDAAKGVWAVADRTGRIIRDANWKNIGQFYEGLAPVVIDGRCGCLNTAGELVIPNLYETAPRFSEGLAAVRLNGKWAYINTSGKTVTGFSYTRAGQVSGSAAPVVLDGNFGIFLKKGLFVQASDTLPLCGNGMAAVSSSGKYALMLLSPTEADAPGYTGSTSVFAEEYGLAESIGLLNYLPRACDYSARITRADFCRIIIAFYNAAGGQTSPSINNPFNDCADSFVLEAYSVGLVMGRSATEFYPDDDITMQEICVVVHRLANLLGVKLEVDAGALPLSDSTISAWAEEPVRYAVMHGLIDGASFRSEHRASAEEAMLVVLNFAFSEVEKS